jgi:L-fuconolactonase
MKQIVALALALITPGILVGADEPPLPRAKHMIDTHIHLYDTTRKGGVPWPQPEDKILYKPHLADEFKQVSQAAGLTGVVIVEASDRLVDNQWVLDHVSDDDYFVALVGNIDPYREDFEEQLKRLKKDPRFVGIRARNAREKPPIKYDDPQVLESFRALARHGLSVDILAGNGGVEVVEQVDRLAREIPQLHIVINHCIGYRIDGSDADPAWVAAVEKLAENKNVWCKVSGLYQRSIPQPAPINIDHYRKVIDVLWDNFGEKRLVYGSNWPCTKNSSDYESYVRLVNSYFSTKGDDACERYFWKNATEAYRLDIN